MVRPAPLTGLLLRTADRGVPRIVLCAVLLALLFISGPAAAGDIKRDEEVVFFTTTAVLDEGAGTWAVPVHGWIFEPRRGSWWRRVAIRKLQRHLGVESDSEEGRRCTERATLFLADNQRRKRLHVRIAGKVYLVDPTAADGHVRSSLPLAAIEVAEYEKDGALEIEAVLDDDDPRCFVGNVLVPTRSGISVVSDIDDTIKISNVGNREELLRLTFTRPFEPVPGMARAYAAWAERGAVFHYLSSSPWQLYPALESFRHNQGFPAGAYHLKNVRLTGRSLRNLTASPLETKPPMLSAIPEHHPHDRFLLVGDSGEKDPEVYGLIARAHPEQVLHIFIRRIDGADNGEERFDGAFAGVETTKWTVFDDADDLTPEWVPWSGEDRQSSSAGVPPAHGTRWQPRAYEYNDTPESPFTP